MTALDNNSCVSCCINSCATYGGECTVFDSNITAVNCGENLNVISVAICDHCTVTGNGYVSACANIKDFANCGCFAAIVRSLVTTGSSAVCNCLACKIKCYFLTVYKLDSFCDSNVFCKNYAIACRKNCVEISLVSNGYCSTLCNGSIKCFVSRVVCASVNKNKLAFNNSVSGCVVVMTESRDNCAGSFIITTLANTFFVSGVAFLCASRIDLGNVFNSVSKRRNYILCNENFAALGAVRSLCKTCVLTSGSNCLVGYNIVTERSNDCTGSFIIASYANTFLVSRVAFFCASRIDLGNVFNSVSHCRNYILCNENFAALGAVRTFGLTICSTSSSNCIISYYCVVFTAKVYATYFATVVFISCMTLCRDYVLSKSGYTTNRALLAVSKTCFCTSSSLTGNYFVSMTLRGNCFCLNCFAANGANLMLASVFGASSFFIYGPAAIGMTLCRDYILSKSGYTANRALLTFSKTIFCTGCSLAGNYFVSMTFRGNCFCLNCFAAN